MYKKISATLVAVIVALLTAQSIGAEASQLKKNEMSIVVNEKQFTFPTILYKQENYVKLRDLAYILKDYRDFTVDYKNKTITVGNGIYSPKGDELKSKISLDKSIVKTEDILFDSSKRMTFNVITCLGYNYFRLRDMGKAFKFDAVWNAKEKKVMIKDVEKSKGKAISFTELASASNETSRVIRTEEKDNKIAITYSVKVYTGGYSLKTKEIILKEGRLIIVPDIIAPPADAFVTQAIAYPSTTVLIDKKDLPDGCSIEIFGQNDNDRDSVYSDR